MRSRHHLSWLIAAFACLIPAWAQAGAGAIVIACVHLPTTPVEPLKVKFVTQAGTDRGMSNRGQNADMQVTSAGLTCANLGYVEGNDVGFDRSSWTLNYSIDKTAYSGSAESIWWKWVTGNNHVEMKTASKGTVICSGAALCTAATQEWREGTLGPLYFIFQPQAGQ